MVKSPSVRWLESFHNRCIRMILDVSRTQQWKEWITSTELADRFGMTENMVDILKKHCLRWLGHLARMDSSRLPKQLLFSELTKTHPRHGPKRRWRDLAVMDVRALGIEGDWYKIAQDRKYSG